MTRASLRHAIFEACPADREAVLTHVTEATAATEPVAKDTLEHLKARGEIYVVEGEVRETGGGA